MHDVKFQLAGLQVRLHAPWPVTVTPRLQPFLCDSRDPAVDCRIQLQLCRTLPALSGLRHGLCCCRYGAQGVELFHLDQVTGAPFAMTSMEREQITLHVLEGKEHFLSDTSGILNTVGLERLLLQYKGLLLHASVIDCRGSGILFAGPSGVGKSTQAALWEQYEQARILNGDRAIVRQTPEGWYAYGSPYAGTSGIYKNEKTPIRALVVLQQGAENRLQRLNPAQALRQLYPEISMQRWDRQFVEQATGLFLELAEQIPIYLLTCRPDREAVRLLRDTITEGGSR